MNENFKKILKSELGEERYQHSIGVELAAIELAEMFNLDKIKASIAGLLHDCAKEIPYEKMLEIIKENNLDIPDDIISCKKILHAPLSAFIAKTKYGIHDKEILKSIELHTTGEIGMSDFDKIIYLADKIEINRPSCYAKPIRDEIYKTDNLNKGMLVSIKLTIKSLLDRNLPINNKTTELYCYYL